MRRLILAASLFLRLSPPSAEGIDGDWQLLGDRRAQPARGALVDQLCDRWHIARARRRATGSSAR